MIAWFWLESTSPLPPMFDALISGALLLWLLPKVEPLLDVPDHIRAKRKLKKRGRFS